MREKREIQRQKRLAKTKLGADWEGGGEGEGGRNGGREREGEREGERERKKKGWVQIFSQFQEWPVVQWSWRSQRGRSLAW